MSARPCLQRCLGPAVLFLLVGAVAAAGQQADEPAAPAATAADTTTAEVRTAGPTAGGQAAASAELPAYLRELQELARQRLEAGASPASGAPSDVSLRSVRVSGEEYGRYVGRASFTGSVDGSRVTLTRPMVPRVVVHDRTAIDYLFHCCAYDDASAGDIEFVEIYDLGAAGISNGDVLVTHPAGHSYVLDGLDPAFLDAAAAWEQADQQQYAAFHRETLFMPDLVDELSPPETYAWPAPRPELPADQQRETALRAIWAGVHQAVRDQYGVEPLEIHFARDDTTTSLEVWGFEPDSLRFNYVTVGGGQTRNDLLTVTARDTIFETVSSYLDVLVIRESRVDTVYATSTARPAPPASAGPDR
jgi:hypothetical protein